MDYIRTGLTLLATAIKKRKASVLDNAVDYKPTVVDEVIPEFDPRQGISNQTRMGITVSLAVQIESRRQLTLEESSSRTKS